MSDRQIRIKGIFTDNLAGMPPKEWLVHHGPTKLLLNEFLWHEPTKGIVASYKPTAADVADHFNVFRGVDQIESFAQAAVGACSMFIECRKYECTPKDLMDRVIPGFISIGQVNFYSYLELGDTFVNIGHIKMYKFRQMVCDGRIYRVPKGLNLIEYFKDFTEERLLNYGLSSDFTLVADLQDITGRGIRVEHLKK